MHQLIKNELYNSFSNIFSHKLFRNSFIYVLCNFIKISLPFFLLPILTRYLSPFDYGIIATFEILLSIFIVFVGLNAPSAVSVNFFKLSRDDLKIYNGNASYVAIVSFLLTFSIVYFAKTHLAHLLKFPENWLLIMVFVALANYAFSLNITLWQVEEKPLPYGLFLILQTALNFGLSVYFIIVLRWQWQGRFMGIIISSIIFGLISVFILYKRDYLKFSFNPNYIKDILWFGIPLIPHVLGGWLMTAIDRIFINNMVSVAATGIYTVGYQIGAIIGFLIQSFNQAWAPYLFNSLQKNDNAQKVKIVNFTYIMFLLIIMLALLLSIISPFLLKFLVGENFYSAYNYVIWIAFGSAANGMYYLVVNYITFVKKHIY